MNALVNDRKLLNEFKRGHRSALAFVYQEYSRVLFSFLAKGFSINTGGSRYLFQGYKESWNLENAVQEVFLRAFSESARNSYDGLRPYKSYLFQIAKNYVIDGFRKSKKDFILMEEVPEQNDELEFTSNSPEKQTQEAQLKLHVGKFIESLSKDDRMLFDVRFEQGLSVEECEKRLPNHSEYRVKKDEKVIRKRFYHYMKDLGYFEGFNYEGLGGKSQLMLLVLLAGGTTTWH